jgi:hypothetical protein
MSTPREEAEAAIQRGERLTPAQLQALLENTQVVGQEMVQTTQAIAGTLSKEAGLGVPPGKVVIDPSVQSPRSDVERRLQALDFHGIWKNVEGMTGYRPPLPTFDIRVYDNPAHEQHQAEISVNANMMLGTSASGDRLALYPHEQRYPNSLSVNDSFLQHQPDEARGVAYHELGHVWTQAMLLHPEAYSEGFAELFRSAAAEKENARWQQACGIRPYQVLHGEKEPQLVANMRCSSHISHSTSARYIVSQRLRQLLGGIDDRKLAGIAKACSMPGSPSPVRPLAEILDAVERETGVQGFAQQFLQDPVLKPGNLTPGKRAFAFRNLAGNYAVIKCFEVTDTAALHEQSRQTFAQPESVKSIHVNNENFYMEGVKAHLLPYSLRLIHPRGVELRMNATGDFLLTPAQIMKIGKQAGAAWPSGTTHVEFSLPGESPVLLEHALEISVEEHAALCAKMGLPVR